MTEMYEWIQSENRRMDGKGKRDEAEMKWLYTKVEFSINVDWTYHVVL